MKSQIGVNDFMYFGKEKIKDMLLDCFLAKQEVKKTRPKNYGPALFPLADYKNSYPEYYKARRKLANANRKLNNFLKLTEFIYECEKY